MDNTVQKVPENLLEFATSHLGTIKKMKTRGWKHLETGVWELETEQGRAFLKSHRQKAKFGQELRAYLEFLPHALKVTPSLLAYDESQQAMLLSDAPGELVDDLALSLKESVDWINESQKTDLFSKSLGKKQLISIYEQAGQFLRSYHDVPYQDTETLNIEEAFWQRAESWLKRAEPFVAAKDIDWVKARVKDMLPALNTMKRVPCHRDYTGRNWLWNEKLYVIDFEHSRPDVWLFDLEKLWSEVWPHLPELKESFMAGYGHNFTAEDEALLNGYTALSCITKIAWSYEHDDNGEYAELGRRILESLKQHF
jgi:aminoglycoside/choline kinase family phosphotransferase